VNLRNKNFAVQKNLLQSKKKSLKSTKQQTQKKKKNFSFLFLPKQNKNSFCDFFFPELTMFHLDGFHCSGFWIDFGEKLFRDRYFYTVSFFIRSGYFHIHCRHVRSVNFWCTIKCFLTQHNSCRLTLVYCYGWYFILQPQSY